MTYQIIYSSDSKMPMQSDDLEELLQRARHRNGIQGISGALIYTDGVFLQILEGERATVEALMADIRRDPRHTAVDVLREGEIPSAKFSSWKMAYVAATEEQLARWAGISVATENRGAMDDVGGDRDRTAQFVQDILALLSAEDASGPAREQDGEQERP